MKVVLVAIGLLATTSQVLARSTGAHLEDRWNPQHISGLPINVRNALERMCGASRAEHQLPVVRRGFLFCISNTFGVAIAVPFARRPGAYIRFMRRPTVTIGC